MRLFDVENPVWRFVGNIADMFLLSVLWYLCCIPIFTAGAGTTAMYYVTMKLTANQEGYTLPSFWQSFRRNFRQASILWLGVLAIGGVLAADIFWAVSGGSPFGFYLLPAFAVMALLFLMVVSFLFPLLARCENTLSALVKMCCAIVIREFMPIFSALLLTVGLGLAGVFLFWPLLLLTPGLTAYLNAYLYNRILAKYQLSLPESDTGR